MDKQQAVQDKAVATANKLGILSGPPLAYFVEGWEAHEALSPTDAVAFFLWMRKNNNHLPDWTDDTIERFYREFNPSGEARQIGNNPTYQKTCPLCGSHDIVMFDSDNDLCNKCGKWFPAVEKKPVNAPAPPAAGPVQDKNFNVRFAAMVDRKMTETGVWDKTLKGCKHFNEYDNLQTKFFDSLKTVKLEEINKPPAPAQQVFNREQIEPLLYALDVIANNDAYPLNEAQAFSWVDTARITAGDELRKFTTNYPVSGDRG